MTPTLEDAQAFGFSSCEEHQQWLETQRRDDRAYTIILEGAPLLYGDISSIAGIFKNIAGQNEMEDHAAYLQMMERMTETTLVGHLALLDNEGAVIRSVVIPNYETQYGAGAK